ncbi:DNA-directed RNA polymerase subunit H [Candidatus Woesearchaeota archaeon]|nr:DNA-directed RNA polymerase subunit H [Candidatus Woesearchaeota archaeon]
MGKTFNVEAHHLVPKHTKLSDAETKKLFEKYNITSKELPKILDTDPVIESLGAKAGDVIKVNRASETAGETVYYREVVDE